jgi:hypothetical protein
MEPEMSTTKYLTRADLHKLLRERGYPISFSTLNQICAPARGEGPPAAAVWPGDAGGGAGRPLYDAETALQWAENRLVRPLKRHPG